MSFLSIPAADTLQNNPISFPKLLLFNKMVEIKVKVEDLNEEDLNCEGYCFICLHPITLIKDPNLLNFLFNYLKVGEKVKSVVCQKCEDNLRKFVKLCNILEKTRLEMDYLLDIFQSAIWKSSQDFSSQFFYSSSVRKTVMEKCKKQVRCPRPEIILHRLDLSPTSEDFSANNWDHNSNSGEDPNENPATPVIEDIIKQEVEHFSQTTKKKKLSKRKKEVKCPTCSKSFGDGGQLNRHIKTVHLRLRPFKIFKCPTCFKSFGAKESLNRHTNVVHLRLLPFKCPTCHKLFSTRKTLRIHIDAVHLRLKPFKCDICSRSFTTAASLKRHKAAPHKPKLMPNSRTVSCKICEKDFVNSDTLNQHNKTVHGEKRFSCDICQKRFVSNATLRIHISGVHKKLRHYCQAGCDTSYASESSLIVHYRLEHPDFTIPRKGPDYSGKFTLKIENGKSVAKCKLCTKKFETATAVKRHIRKVHGPKSFKCQHCSYATTYVSQLRRHELVHKNKINTKCTGN